MGGLVIQAYLAKALRDRTGHELKNIRQAIFIATPHHGSKTFAVSRNFLSRILKNPQERMLEALNANTHDIVEEFKKRTADWPLAVQCFWGMQDDIVPEPSARGSHADASPLEGNHFTILNPHNLHDDRYILLRDTIRNPGGHPDIFEIESFKMEVKLQPLPTNATRIVQFGRQGRSKKVISDNKAFVTHTVKFSRQNRCMKPYKLRYRTRHHGAVIAHLRITVGGSGDPPEPATDGWPKRS
jgi:hypothetical protein